MNNRVNLCVALLCSSSLLVYSAAALAQQQAGATETVVVTGSRVISDAVNSPTPLTIVTTEQLQATTPTDIPDALNKLPDFVGSNTQRTTNNASTNATGNVLNLRNFGTQRTLVLFDGHRVVASNANGTTDVDTLPQMLMSRVDVVTGGASAVYGSDAVTGVVNFVLDKKFSGIKYNANAGIAGLGVGAYYKVGVAMGTDLFGGKGHIEGSFQLFHQDHVPMVSLPYGPRYFASTGNGNSAASPITEIENARAATSTFGGYVLSCGTGCTAANQQFVSSGVLGPFAAGTPSLTSSAQIGGDGYYSDQNDAAAGLKTYETFTRFSYALDNNTSLYVQGSASQSQDYNHFFSTVLSGNAENTYFKNNAYLSAAAQAALNTGTGTTFVSNKLYSEWPGWGTLGINRALDMTVGADGTVWGDFDWDMFFTHDENRLSVDNIGDPNDARVIAANDAVLAPAGNTAGVPAGTIVCNVTLTNPTLYPGCTPLNAFGPRTSNLAAYKWVSQTTNWHQTNTLDDFGGSIAGTLFDLPAGPLKAALSAEVRWVSLQLDSLYTPTQTVDCTGLRLCLAPGTPLWNTNTVAPVPFVSENVWEFGGEMDVPLLKDMPLVQSLNANLAGRYTNYSATGSVQTWKIGLDYHISDDVRFRGTTSVDIRAPNLNDLFGPVQSNIAGYNDLHTNTAGAAIVQQSGGNPNLVPEVARTYTAGVVLTPTFIPEFTLSVDYYQIDLKNAIGNVGGNNNVVANLCEASGGTSPFCALYVRPFPFSNHTAANYPSQVLSTSLNAAYSAVSGIDIEVNYGFDLADVWENMPGRINLRELVGMQPVNETQSFATQPFTYTAQAKIRSSAFVNYTTGDWTISLQDRWISGYKKVANLTTIYYADPRVDAQNYLDLNISRKVMIDDMPMNVFLSVENVTNNFGPITGGLAGSPGFSYPVPNGYPVQGRTFSFGVRGTL